MRATHRKLNMLPSTRSLKSDNLGFRNPVDLSTLLQNDPDLQEKYEADMDGLGLKDRVHALGDAFFWQDEEGNNVLHLAAKSRTKLTFERVLMKVLRRCVVTTQKKFEQCCSNKTGQDKAY